MASERAATGLVIVPAFNEAESIRAVTDALREHAPAWDVLVVDDGSTDGTREFTAPGVLVIHLPFNLGIGGAMQAGYRFADVNGYRLAVQVDGDGQHPPEAIPELAARQEKTGADMVIGSRFLEPGLYQQSLFRKMGAALIRVALRLVTGRRFSDPTSGFRLVNTRAIRAFAYWYPDDYPEPEVLLHFHRAGLVVEETSVRMQQRTSGASSIPLGRGVMYVAKVVTALFLALLRRPWPRTLLQA